MAVLPRFARCDNGRDDNSSGASSNHGRSWVWSTCTSLCGDRIACASGGVLDLKRLTGASTIGQTPTLSRAGYGQASSIHKQVCGVHDVVDGGSPLQWLCRFTPH